MGVFDESDDDEDDDHNRIDTATVAGHCRMAATAGAANSFASWPKAQQEDAQEVKQPQRKDTDRNKSEEEEEEEDPLDAYMKSLEQQQQPSSASTTGASTSSQKQHQRLDLENEDDHDDHDHDDNDDDDDHHIFTKKSSSQMMRPGEQESQQKSHQQQSQLQQQSSSSLSSLLTTWRKVFWMVQNTIQGHAWRTNHDVACSMDVDPIYDNFFNLIQQQKQEKLNQGQDSNNIEKQDVDDDDDQLFFFSNKTFINLTLHELGFVQPTIVQSQTIPVILSGKNVLVTAATGQGKTLAYTWPMMIHIMHQQQSKSSLHEQQAEQTVLGPIALILVPTRELALQVNKQIEVLFKAAATATAATAATATASASAASVSMTGPILLTTRAVIGGVGKYILHQQIKKSGGVVHVVVATPGRLLDVLSDTTKKTGLNLQRVTMLILDEVDKMLSMGFEQQVQQILSFLPTNQAQQQKQPLRQTLMFSATLGGRRVEKVAKEWLSSSSSTSSSSSSLLPYVRIAVGQVGECSTSVQQHVIILPNEHAKQSFIIDMLPTLQNVGRTLIFCATRHGCEHLANIIFQKNNNKADDNNNNNTTTSISSIHKEGGEEVGGIVKLEIIHGDRHQSDRVKALKAFTQGRVHVLIATDVAGRGLDVPNVATVINFDPAKNMDSHTHRVGRAGRLSKQDMKKASGSSISNDNDDDNGGSNDNDNVKQHQQQPQEGTAYTLLTPKNADFAHALRNALSRQGRPISQDLNDLANKSRNNVTGGKNSASRRGNSSRGDNNSRESLSASAASYYAPSSQPRSESAPPQKRSRWA